jgi:hypothetical protein
VLVNLSRRITVIVIYKLTEELHSGVQLQTFNCSLQYGFLDYKLEWARYIEREDNIEEATQLGYEHDEQCNPEGMHL